MPVPRQRSARVGTLAPPRRSAVAPVGAPSGPGRTRRRRVVVATLVIASLALLSIYFRESSDGPLHGVQSTGASVLRPFQVAAERVAQPFEDALGWFDDLLSAKSENEKLRAEVERLRQKNIQNQTAIRENAELQRLLRYRRGPS